MLVEVPPLPLWLGMHPQALMVVGLWRPSCLVPFPTCCRWTPRGSASARRRRRCRAGTATSGSAPAPASPGSTSPAAPPPHRTSSSTMRGSRVQMRAAAIPPASPTLPPASCLSARRHASGPGPTCSVLSWMVKRKTRPSAVRPTPSSCSCPPAPPLVQLHTSKAAEKKEEEEGGGRPLPSSGRGGAAGLGGRRVSEACPWLEQVLTTEPVTSIRRQGCAAGRSSTVGGTSCSRQLPSD